MTEQKYVVALDQGTTSSRAVVLDHDANIVSVSQREFTQIYPQAGWVEHDPMEIYATQSSTLVEALGKAGIRSDEVAAIGITNQRETTVVWNKETGKPVYNAIVWQCRRTAAICEELKARGLESYIRDNTGLVLDPYFSGTKIKWILDNVEGAREQAEAGQLLFGTVDTWLVWKMTQGRVHVTDYTNASRTMLFNINTLQWDEKILAEFNIPLSMMPEVKKSSEVYGQTNIGGKGGTRIPIAGIAGDQQAALYGQMCVQAGQAKNTYGTGCFLLMNTGQEKVTSNNGLLTTLACGPRGEPAYALEGAVFMGGASIQWLRDELKLISDARDSEYFATKVDTSNGVYCGASLYGFRRSVLGCVCAWHNCWFNAWRELKPHYSRNAGKYRLPNARCVGCDASRFWHQAFCAACRWWCGRQQLPDAVPSRCIGYRSASSESHGSHRVRRSLPRRSGRWFLGWFGRAARQSGNRSQL